jgi:hypothetical protein
VVTSIDHGLLFGHRRLVLLLGHADRTEAAAVEELSNDGLIAGQQHLARPKHDQMLTEHDQMLTGQDAHVVGHRAGYRALVRAAMMDPAVRDRRSRKWRRWERGAPMELWQMDVAGGFPPADGTSAKALTPCAPAHRPN